MGSPRRPVIVGAASHGVAMTLSKASWTRAEIGAFGEGLAVAHLQSVGLRVLTRNWRCRYGELDVIAADDAARIVVFVEVKTRTSDQFGGIEQAVTPQKVRRLRRLAGLWLAGQEGGWSQVRIDVIGVRIGRRRIPEISHLQGVG
jgi:putative endonuclease